jgi:predicted RNase H-like HicB family nuclease
VSAPPNKGLQLPPPSCARLSLVASWYPTLRLRRGQSALAGAAEAESVGRRNAWTPKARSGPLPRSGSRSSALPESSVTAILEKDGDWFIACCPQIPDANGRGRTREEARESLADTISLILADRREDALGAGPFAGSFPPPQSAPEGHGRRKVRTDRQARSTARRTRFSSSSWRPETGRGDSSLPCTRFQRASRSSLPSRRPRPSSLSQPA